MSATIRKETRILMETAMKEAMKTEYKNYWGIPEYIQEVKPYDMLDEDYLILLRDKSNGLTNKNILSYEERAWVRWYMSNPNRKYNEELPE